MDVASQIYLSLGQKFSIFFIRSLAMIQPSSWERCSFKVVEVVMMDDRFQQVFWKIFG
jgi:hypothetical protein